MTISPVTFELTANPGDILENKLKVYNPSDFNIVVGMEAEDFEPIGELGQVVVTESEKTTYSLKQWVKIDPISFSLQPKEQKVLNFKIEVPSNAEPGGHYGSVLATIKGAIGEGTGAALTQKVGSLVLISIAGEVKEHLIVKEFFAPSFSEYGPIKFDLRFENLGTVHVRPKGFIVITRGTLLESKKIAEIEFPQKNVLPGAKRKLDAVWNEKWLFGKYTATIVGAYGISNTPFTAAATFWVFPWKLAGGLFIGFAMVLVFFFKTGRRWRMALKILLRGEKSAD